MEQITQTIFFTVIAGVLIYVIGQLIDKFFLIPIQKQKEIIGEIADYLIYFANIYTSPLAKNIAYNPANENLKREYTEASQKLRKISSMLNSRTQIIPQYKFLSLMHFILPGTKIAEASKELIALSNSLFDWRDGSINEFNMGVLNGERADKIRNLLNIPKID